MKRCPKCMEWLSLLTFASRGVGRGPTSYCRPCQNAYSKDHYRRYARPHNRRRYANTVRYRQRNAENLRSYLQGHACVDCAERDIRALEFDHVRGTKLGSVAEMSGRGLGWRRIEDEIAKCEVRCANCHRRKTVNELGWWRSVGT